MSPTTLTFTKISSISITKMAVYKLEVSYKLSIWWELELQAKMTLKITDRLSIKPSYDCTSIKVCFLIFFIYSWLELLQFYIIASISCYICSSSIKLIDINSTEIISLYLHGLCCSNKSYLRQIDFAEPTGAICWKSSFFLHQKVGEFLSLLFH